MAGLVAFFLNAEENVDAPLLCAVKDGVPKTCTTLKVHVFFEGDVAVTAVIPDPEPKFPYLHIAIETQTICESAWCLRPEEFLHVLPRHFDSCSGQCYTHLRHSPITNRVDFSDYLLFSG